MATDCVAFYACRFPAFYEGVCGYNGKGKRAGKRASRVVYCGGRGSTRQNDNVCALHPAMDCYFRRPRILLKPCQQSRLLNFKEGLFHFKNYLLFYSLIVVRGD